MDWDMAEIMEQLEILSKNVMGAGASVNIVGIGCAKPNKSKFEALYNEDVNFLAKEDVVIVKILEGEW